jgi:hypothetical protein
LDRTPLHENPQVPFQSIHRVRTGGRVFKYFLISIALVPILLGVSAAKERDIALNRSALRVRWLIYGVLWFSVLYYLRYRWS